MRLKQLSMVYVANVAKDGLFWLGIVTSPQFCDVTLTWGTGIVTSYSSFVVASATSILVVLEFSTYYQLLYNLNLRTIQNITNVVNPNCSIKKYTIYAWLSMTRYCD